MTKAAHTFQDIETDAAEFVDVGVVNLGQESDLWWGHRVVIWQEQFEFEDTAFLLCQPLVARWCVKKILTFIWRLSGAVYRDIKISEVVFVRDCADAWNTAGINYQPQTL